MNKEKHTPGPWIVRNCTVRTSGDLSLIADLSISRWNFGRAEANAKLIAAAPELLDACNLALQEMVRFRNASATDQVQQHWDSVSERAVTELAKAITKVI